MDAIESQLADKKRLKLLASMAQGKILDVGCHDINNPFLDNVTGFDLHKPKYTPDNYSDYIVGNCEKIHEYFPNTQFDTIIAGELIEHLENPANFLRSCCKILKKDGTLLLTTPNPYHWSTIIGNMFFVHSRLTSDHINLIPFRAMLALTRYTGWHIERVVNASGGLRLWPTTRKYFLPCPKAMAWQHLYVCRKDRKLAEQTAAELTEAVGQ